MDVRFQVCLLLSVYVMLACIVHAQELFGVVEENGKFYKTIPPQHSGDSWLGTATLIGDGGWADFKQLFFHPDGTLYGVLHGKFYKGPLPSSVTSRQNWIANEATVIGTSGWHIFKFLFFHPNGDLYGVTDDGKFYARAPPTHGQDQWLRTAKMLGDRAWNNVKFLFFDPQGILYSVALGTWPGNVYKRYPPTGPSDQWYYYSDQIGTGTWDEFRMLFFMSDGELNGVYRDRFYKRSPPSHPKDNWIDSAKLIGSGGWSMFKFLMSPL